MIGKLVLIAAIIAQALCAPDVSRRAATTSRNPVRLTFDELNYIVRSRNGIDSSNVKPKLITPCARAILGCCNGSVMDSDCSESVKCGAYFFDDNPCDEKFILSALQAAKEFYEQFNTVQQ